MGPGEAVVILPGECQTPRECLSLLGMGKHRMDVGHWAKEVGYHLISVGESSGLGFWHLQGSVWSEAWKAPSCWVEAESRQEEGPGDGGFLLCTAQGLARGRCSG